MDPVGTNTNSSLLAGYLASYKKQAGSSSTSDVTTNDNLTDSTGSDVSDSASISNTAKVFNKVDDLFNLGKDGRIDIAEIDKMKPQEKEEFLKMVAARIKSGDMGYEVLEVNGKPEKHYIDMEIGDERIKGAKLYRKDYPDDNRETSKE